MRLCYYSNGFILKFRIYEFEYLAVKLLVIFVKFVQRQCGCIKAGYWIAELWFW